MNHTNRKALNETKIQNKTFTKNRYKKSTKTFTKNLGKLIDQKKKQQSDTEECTHTDSIAQPRSSLTVE